MKQEQEIIQETIKIPIDMIIDILSVIVKENLTHETIQVIENRSLIVIAISYDKNFSRHQNLLNDIRTMLEDYDNFRSQEEEQENVNWR